jgi:hypothetical protein
VACSATRFRSPATPAVVGHASPFLSSLSRSRLSYLWGVSATLAAVGHNIHKSQHNITRCHSYSPAAVDRDGAPPCRPSWRSPTVTILAHVCRCPLRPPRRQQRRRGGRGRGWAARPGADLHPEPHRAHPRGPRTEAEATNLNSNHCSCHVFLADSQPPRVSFMASVGRAQILQPHVGTPARRRAAAARGVGRWGGGRGTAREPARADEGGAVIHTTGW